MSDFNMADLETAVEETVEPEQVIEEPEQVIEEPEQVIDPTEAKAREKGWVPKDEFAGEDWVDANEFNRRGELFDKISYQNKTIKDLNKKLDALVDHNKKIEERATEKALTKLKQERREAIEYGDADKVDQLDQQMQTLTEVEKPATTQNEVPDFVQEFADTNPWFEKDQEMTEFMLYKTQNLVNSGVELKQAIKQADEVVKKTFPNKFVNPAKKKAAVMRDTPSKVAPKKFGYGDLEDSEKAIYRTLKNAGMSDESIFAQFGE